MSTRPSIQNSPIAENSPLIGQSHEAQPAHRPNPQVIVKPTRRRFTNAQKLRILAEADTCSQPGQLGALLRREGLYSSNLSRFRKQRDEGKLGKSPEQTRRAHLDKEAARQRDARRIAHLEAENRKLTILLELQKKLPT